MTTTEKMGCGLGGGHEPRGIFENDNDIVLYRLSRNSESDLSRHGDIVKLKLFRCRYLLWRRSQLQKKIDAINDELAAMMTEDISA